MSELQRLGVDHESALLDFERENRAYFARSVSDRGDGYFDHFSAVLAAEVAEDESGDCAYYVHVAPDGAILGRFNLRGIRHGSASLGYRVAESAAGRGLATEGVRQLCEMAADVHGLHLVRASVSDANVASGRVLLKAGFVRVGPATPAELGGKAGSRYTRLIGGSGALG